MDSVTIDPVLRVHNKKTWNSFPSKPVSLTEEKQVLIILESGISIVSQLRNLSPIGIDERYICAVEKS